MLESRDFDFCGSKSDQNPAQFRQYMQELTEYVLENDVVSIKVTTGDLGWGIEKGVNEIVFKIFNPAA